MCRLNDDLLAYSSGALNGLTILDTSNYSKIATKSSGPYVSTLCAVDSNIFASGGCVDSSGDIQLWDKRNLSDSVGTLENHGVMYGSGIHALSMLGKTLLVS